MFCGSYKPPRKINAIAISNAQFRTNIDPGATIRSIIRKIETPRTENDNVQRPERGRHSIDDRAPGWRIRGIYRYWDDCTEPLSE